MKGAWQRGRAAWERSEGVLAALFPDLDQSMDARYEDFSDARAARAQWDPDRSTAAESRALQHRAHRVPARHSGHPSSRAEATLAGAQPAAWPRPRGSGAVQQGLVGRWSVIHSPWSDAWAPDAVDLHARVRRAHWADERASREVSLAGLQLDESRYSQRTNGRHSRQPDRDPHVVWLIFALAGY